MGAHVAERPIDGNYVAIGWQEVGDLTQFPADREVYKLALVEAHPDKKPGAIPVDAGSIYKFVHVIQAGDLVVYPSKSDRMVNIGRFTGPISFHEEDPDGYPTRRDVTWLGRFPRDEFSQAALHEIGSFLTLFRVKRHAAEFLSKVQPGAEPVILDDTDDEIADDDTATASAAIQAETSTSDFVIKRLMSDLSGHQFEELMAHLLECMGYTARVTPKSGDGGVDVDVIAHMDPLGFQPPIVKVQCKRTTSQTPRPDVDRLLGTLGDGEYGLFVNLGSYAKGAVELERNRAKLRLINGEQFVELIMENYANLSPRYRAIIPLKQIFVPDLQQD